MSATGVHWQHPSCERLSTQPALGCHYGVAVVQSHLRVRMRHAAEVVLRQRLCRWQQCRAIFWICSHCDRGHQYCSEHCRSKARREQRRAANRRHRQSPEGKLDQRDRQRDYRRRRAAASVMDQGSPSDTVRGNIPLPACNPPAAAKRGGKHAHKSRMTMDTGMPCCLICGRTSRYVNPFP